VARSFHRSLGIALLIVSTASAQGTPEEARTRLSREFERDIVPILSRYCIACHGFSKPKSDLNLSLFRSGEAALSKPQVWKEAASRISSFEMPPKKEPTQPTPDERARVAAWVAGFRQLQPKDPGRGTIRRLSQVEYANTLADLLGADPKVADEIPRDEVGPGFNSSIPPLLMEKYLAVAEAALEDVIKPDQLKLKWTAGQLRGAVDGRFAGPGEVNASFIAPAEGSYAITIRAGSEKPPGKLAVRVNGESVGEARINAAPNTPGPTTITCKLLPGSAVLSVGSANPFLEPAPAGAKPAPRNMVLESIEIVGPPGAKPTAQQRRLFVAAPGKDLPPRDAARKILEPFARRAFRRPPRPAELDALLKVFELADHQGAMFTESVRLMLKAALVSPSFLYLTPDDGTANGADGAIVPLGDHQLASRLSYLFWSTMPDDELSALADAGKLRDPAVLAAQVRRLIADARSRALFQGFGAAWLGLDHIAELDIDEKKFPLMTKPMRRAMLEEASLLFDAILRGNRSILEFIDCDYTFANDTLARVYGLDVKDSKMVRVPLTDRNRGGILTLPGVLAVTSLPNRTSPVKRGRWVLEQVLGQTPPAPPADVPPLDKQDAGAAGKLNLRQKMERHRSNPACFGCHQTIDPIGFGLENFDVVGRWRDKDESGLPIDAKGELPGDIRFSGPAELKRIVLARKDEFCRNLVRRILAHTLCRSLSGYDEIVADEIADAVARDGYRFQTIWIQVATSYPFLNRRISR